MDEHNPDVEYDSVMDQWGRAPSIVILGTLDTKLNEILYLRRQILFGSLGINPLVQITLIDCGRQNVSHEAITVSHADLISGYAPADTPDPKTLPRGEVIRLMTACATKCVKELVEARKVDGIISAGGSGGSSLACAVMRDAAPIGMPKLMVSTVASGDTGPLIGETDITMMYSVADIAGNNGLLRQILGNAAGAIVGMATEYKKHKSGGWTEASQPKKTRVGITMFGVTTPGVDKIRQHLEEAHQMEVYVFHATGHGGRAMERLVSQGELDAILDLTTTEICDYLMGGNMSAGGDRLEAALKKGLPTIISLGATDMVNFGPKATVPSKFHDRKLFEHNPTVTLMRTTVDECAQIGDFIVGKIKGYAKDPKLVEVWLPRGGVSLIATPGAAFADEEADAATANTILKGLGDSAVKVIEDKRAINNEGFAVDIAEVLVRKIREHGQRT